MKNQKTNLDLVARVKREINLHMECYHHDLLSISVFILLSLEKLKKKKSCYDFIKS